MPPQDTVTISSSAKWILGGCLGLCLLLAGVAGQQWMSITGRLELQIRDMGEELAGVAREARETREMLLPRISSSDTKLQAVVDVLTDIRNNVQQYVPRSELDARFSRIEERLDKLESR